MTFQTVGGSGTSTTPRRSQARIDTSDVKSYASLRDLRADAASVAVIDPTTVTHVETINGIPFTVTTATVQSTLSGQPLPSTIELRQTGDGSDANWPIVSPSATYVAYLQPFRFSTGGQVGDQYVVVGDLQGLFAHARDSAPSGGTSFDAVTPDAGRSPAAVTVDEARTN